MSYLSNFIENNDVMKTKNLISLLELKEVEKVLSVNMGPQLKNYIIEYGFLAYEYVELYGVNSKQNLSSDMIKVTQMLHENYKITVKMIALENRGDADYVLIDENDNVYMFDPSINKDLKSLNKKMFDYILERFTQCLN